MPYFSGNQKTRGCGTIFHAEKWFSTLENGFSRWKMIFHAEKWISTLKHDFPRWKMVFHAGK